MPDAQIENPILNNHGAFGRWGFIEIDDPWHANATICASIGQAHAQPGGKRRA